MKASIAAGEIVVANEGHKDPKCFLGSDVDGEHPKSLGTIRAWQKTVNRRFKQFFVLGRRF